MWKKLRTFLCWGIIVLFFSPILGAVENNIKKIQIATLNNIDSVNVFLRKNVKKLKEIDLPIYIKKIKDKFVVYTYVQNEKEKKLVLKKYPNSLIFSNVSSLPLINKQTDIFIYTNNAIVKYPENIIKENLDKIKNLNDRFKTKYLKCYKDIIIIGKTLVVPFNCIRYTYPFLNLVTRRPIKFSPNNSNYMKLFYIKEDNKTNAFQNKITSHAVKINEEQTQKENFVSFEKDKKTKNLEEKINKLSEENNLSQKVQNFIDKTNQLAKNFIYKNTVDVPLDPKLVGIKRKDLLMESPFLSQEIIERYKNSSNTEKTKKRETNATQILKNTKIELKVPKKEEVFNNKNVLIIINIIVIIIAVIVLFKKTRNENNDEKNKNIKNKIENKNLSEKINDAVIKEKNEINLKAISKTNEINTKEQKIIEISNNNTNDNPNDNTKNQNFSEEENRQQNLEEKEIALINEKTSEDLENNEKMLSEITNMNENKKDYEEKLRLKVRKKEEELLPLKLPGLDENVIEKEKIKEELKKELLLKKPRRKLKRN